MNLHDIVILSSSALEHAGGFHTILIGRNAPNQAVARAEMAKITGVVSVVTQSKVAVRWHTKNRQILQYMNKNDVMHLPMFSLHEEVELNGAKAHIIGVHDKGTQYTLLLANGSKVVADVRDISKVHEVS